MTLSEFKAWFEGFTESIEGAPTEAQFAKIKDKVVLIDGVPITYPVYVDRWWPRVNWWEHPVTAGDPLPLKAWYATSNAGPVATGGAYAQIDPASKGGNQTVTFDSHAAMRDLGRAEALN
jgi:hypothetical protein